MKSIINQIKNSWPFLLGLILGLHFVLFNVMGWDLNYLPGDLGDTRFNIYILEHGYQTIFGSITDYWNAPFMIPEEGVISYSDNLLGTVPIYSTFRLFGLSIFNAFQLWFIAITILNYTSAYYCLKWILKNKEAAVIGAFIFAFSIALQSQISHAQTFPRFYIPLALWMMLMFAKELQPKHFFLAVLFLVLQFYNGIYLGFLLLIPLGIMSFTSLIFNRKKVYANLKNWKWTSCIVLSLLSNALLLYLLMEPYYLRSSLGNPYEYEQIVESIPTLRSFIYTGEGSYLWSFLDFGKNYNAHGDHRLFPGSISLISFGIFIILLFTENFRAFLKEVTPITWKILAITIIITFGLFFRYQGISLYYLIFQLPGFNSMRSITRIINVELLFFGLFAAILFLYFIQKGKHGNIRITFLILLGLIVIDNSFRQDNIHRFPKWMAEQRLTFLIEKMDGIPKGSIVSYEPLHLNEPSHLYQLDAMLASQQLELKCVNGYSATAPYCFDKFWVQPNEENRLIWFDVEGFSPDTIYIIH